jgi:hypothetical protein
MHVEGVIRYLDARPKRVFAMLTDAEFQRQKCAATGSTSYEVDITEAGPNTVITCRRLLPIDDLPDFVRPFAAGGLELVEVISWGPPGADDERTGDVRLEFTDRPLVMTGRLDMATDGDGTTARLNAELVASVPLLGSRIEKACEPLVQKALRIEEGVGTKWLAEHP